MTPTQINELCERIICVADDWYIILDDGRTCIEVDKLEEIIRAEFAKVMEGGTHGSVGSQVTSQCLDTVAVGSSPASVATPDSESWIENTGVMPVAGDVVVDVRFRDGEILRNYPAWRWYWGSSGVRAGREITHWRLHKPVEAVESEAIDDAVAGKSW